MAKFSNFKVFMAVAAVLAGLALTASWVRGQNESAVGANVLIALDRADTVYADLDFLPHLENAIQKAEDKGDLTPLTPDALKPFTTDIADAEKHKLSWALIGMCDPGQRKELIPPDPIVVQCTSQLSSTRAKLNKTLGKHLADAAYGTAYLEKQEAELFERKKIPLCHKIFGYARGNVTEEYFEPSTLLFYFRSCDEARQRILLSKETDAAFKACLTDDNIDHQQDCIDDVLHGTNFDIIAKPLN